MTSEPAARTITVSGSGTAEAVPDLLTISVGVECRRGTVGEAYAHAGEASAAISASFRRHGVADADIRTTGLNVRADLAWHEGEGQTVTGYVASSVLTVRVRELASASAAISAVVDAGGNDVRLQGLELGLSNEAEVQARARAAAWQDALTSAEQFASFASARLGAVVSVNEASGIPAPVPVARIQRAVSAEALNVERGETSVSAGVTVVWELLD